MGFLVWLDLAIHVRVLQLHLIKF